MTIKKHLISYLTLPALAAALVGTATLASCDIETSDNGSLDGHWHLVAVDTLATGGTADLSDSLIFWGVQAKLLNVTNKRENYLGYYLRFEQTADSLIVKEPYKNNWHQDQGDNGGDIPVDNPQELSQYGISGLEDHFYKEALSGSKMILRSKTLRLKFKKF